MQRSSNILKQKGMRKGMAMIIAIAFLVVVATLMALMLNLTTQTSHRTQHLYFNEQAQLLAKSATEFAILAISGHDRAGLTDCLQTITSQFPAGGTPFFNINTTIRYIGLGNAVGTCETNSFVDTIATAQSQGTVLIDVYVTSIEGNLNLGETISYHRRTLQKP